MPNTVWDGITCPFPNFNGCIVGVREWVSNPIPHFIFIVGYALAGRSYPFVCTLHHPIIIIVQTYLTILESQNVCHINFAECVRKISHIISVIHYTICGTVCLRFIYFPFDDWDNIYTLSYYQHQIGSMNYYPLFMVIKWNNGIRCMSLNILMDVITFPCWD